LILNHFQGREHAAGRPRETKIVSTVPELRQNPTSRPFLRQNPGRPRWPFGSASVMARASSAPSSASTSQTPSQLLAPTVGRPTHQRRHVRSNLSHGWTGDGK
jgi:hypothetical protein